MPGAGRTLPISRPDARAASEEGRDVHGRFSGAGALTKYRDAGSGNAPKSHRPTAVLGGQRTLEKSRAALHSATGPRGQRAVCRPLYAPVQLREYER